MTQDFVYLHIDITADSKQINTAEHIYASAVKQQQALFESHFSKKGMDYHSFAPHAKALYLLLTKHLIFSRYPDRDLSILKRAYSALGFKLSCKIYDLAQLEQLTDASCASTSSSTFFALQQLKHDFNQIQSALQRISRNITWQENIDEKSLSNKAISIPPTIETQVNALPDLPGVYIFYDKNNHPIYIGKSIHLKTRVLSHFASRHRQAKELKLFKHTESISYHQTNGEFGALLLESQLIKKHRPIYNRRLRRINNFYTITVSTNANGFHCLGTERTLLSSQTLGQTISRGIYRSKRQAMALIEKLVKAHALCGLFSGLENGKGPCFLYQLNQCHGACISKESNTEYNQRLDEALNHINISDWPFESKIVIEEKGKHSDLNWHVFNKWCYLGSTKTLHQAKKLDSAQKNVVNDVDASKYLSSFIKTHQDKVIFFE